MYITGRSWNRGCSFAEADRRIAKFEAYYSQLNTPCLVVDEPMTRENIERMQQVADANGCTLRPHIKTHKTPYFAKLQQQLGARGITSCKVSESEVMADAGLRDIFIAYPLVGA